MKAITPIHIGAGSQYTNIDYVKVVGKRTWLNRMNVGKVIATLTAHERETFLKDVMQPNFSLTTFLNGKGTGDTVRYPVFYEAGTGEPNPIWECIKTADQPYIPGSSVKGAIRTALLWHQARQDGAWLEGLRQEMQERPNKRKIGSSYVESVFSVVEGRFDAKYDVLKFLQVSDFMPQKSQIHLHNVQTFSLQGVRLVPKTYENFRECVIGEFQGAITLAPGLNAALESPQYRRLEEKLDLLGIDTTLSNEAMLNHIQRRVSEFQDWCLQKEIDLCEFGGKEDALKELRSLKKRNMERSMLRLGYGVGTIYQTLIGLVEEQDPDLAQNIITKLGLGKYPRTVNAGDGALSPPYPKSIEFIRGQRSLGWLEW